MFMRASFLFQPGRGRMFSMPADEMELGLGLHSEPGVERRRVEATSVIVDEILTRLCGCRRLTLSPFTPLVVLVNNLGATTPLEERIFVGECVDWLRARGYRVARLLVGVLCSSLDAHGISITLLKLVDAHWLRLIDTPSAISRHWRATTPNADEIFEPQSQAGAAATSTVSTDAAAAAAANEAALSASLADASLRDGAQKR